MHYSKLKDPGLACLKGMIVTFTAYAAYCFSQASFMKGSIAFALTIVLFLSNDFFEGKMEKKGSC